MEIVPKSSSVVAMLMEAHARYPSPERGSPYDEVLAEVQTRTEQTGAIGKSDIGALMLWKRLDLSTVWSRKLNEMPDREVRAITRSAIALARDVSVPIPQGAGSARRALLTLPGCRKGAAIASTILTAGAPDRMAVYDRRGADALAVLGYPHPNGYYSRFLVAVCELVELVNREAGVGWCPRDVDKALYIFGE